MLISKKAVGLVAFTSITSMFWQTHASAHTLEDHYPTVRLKSVERALLNGSTDRAMDLLKGGIAGIPNDFDRAKAYSLMCKAQHQKRDYFSAEQSCDIAVTIDHTNWNHFNNRGVMRFMLGRFSEALTDFNRAASLARVPAPNSESRKISRNISATARRISSN